jgi:hypothetical protein
MGEEMQTQILAVMHADFESDKEIHGTFAEYMNSLFEPGTAQKDDLWTRLLDQDMDTIEELIDGRILERKDDIERAKVNLTYPDLVKPLILKEIFYTMHEDISSALADSAYNLANLRPLLPEEGKGRRI